MMIICNILFGDNVKIYLSFFILVCFGISIVPKMIADKSLLNIYEAEILILSLHSIYFFLYFLLKKRKVFSSAFLADYCIFNSVILLFYIFNFEVWVG